MSSVSHLLVDSDDIAAAAVVAAVAVACPTFRRRIRSSCRQCV
jgi:hypothetical protein